MTQPISRAARAATLLIVVLALVAPSARPAQAPAGANGAKFDRIVRTAQEKLYDPHMRGLDWPAVASEYRERAERATTKAAFQAVVNETLGRLKTSHTGYYTDDDIEYYLLQSVFHGDLKGYQAEHIGVTGHADGAAFVVAAVLDDSPAAHAGLQSGDRLSMPDGSPFSTVGSFRGKVGQRVAIAVRRPDGERLSVEVVPVKENLQQAFLRATNKSVRVIRRNGKRIGYVHLWCMTSPPFRQALDDALGDALADTDGLLLDLRDGFGGTPFGYGDILFRPGVRWQSSGRDGKADSSATGYARPVVALIDGGTRSAKEYLTYQLKVSKRAVLVGTNTAGAFLGTTGFPIEPDGLLELPVTDLKLDGRRLEGVGVAPDVWADPTLNYSPRDRQMAAGMDTLLGVLGSSPEREPVASGRRVDHLGNS